MNNDSKPNGSSSTNAGHPSATDAAWSSREILEAMLASAPIAIVMADAKGSILYVNSKFEEMFGYTFHELEGQTIEMLIPERFRHDHVKHRRAYAHNPHVRSMGSGMDLAGRRKNGEEFPIEAGLSYVRVGEELIIMGSITDITRRKHIEEVLEHRVEERTREIERRREVSEGLRDILAVLNSNQPLEDILHHIVSQACRLLHADAAAIYRIEDATGQMVMQADTGFGDTSFDNTGLRDSGLDDTDLESAEADDPDTKQTLNDDIDDTQRPATSEAVSVNDHSQTQSLPTEQRAESSMRRGAKHLTVSHIDSGIDITHAQASQPEDFATLPDTNGYQALLTVPLMVKEETFGNLILYYHELRRFSSEEIELATMVGDQTALAIENARLRTQIERSAIAAERSRIARDLHDSVTQTLFSASLIAEVLPRLWQRNPEETERRLDELRQLTRGALAEMRTLLLELRPATLMEVDFRELLRQLTEAITGRSRMPIALAFDGEEQLPPDIKIAFYHIAQEALNNVAKHARASYATVTFHSAPHHYRLTVVDDGAGFVIDEVTPEHLGLTIMHERAEAISARLSIHSELDIGTHVTVEWQDTD